MRVRQAVLESIAAHARRAHPSECCGLLIADEDLVVEAVPATNVASDPRRRYEIAPLEHLAQIRRCREAARAGSTWTVAGAYHSHPHGAPAPSPTDREEAFPGFLYVIAGPADGSSPLEIRAFRLLDGHLVPQPLTVEPPPPAAPPPAR